MHSLLNTGRVLSWVSFSRVHWLVAFSQGLVPGKVRALSARWPPLCFSSVCLERKSLLEMTTAMVICVYCTPEGWPFQVFQHVGVSCHNILFSTLASPLGFSQTLKSYSQPDVELRYFFPSYMLLGNFSRIENMYTRMEYLCWRNLNTNRKSLT